MATKYSKNIQTVLDILNDEVKGDVAAAIRKLTDDYKMTWVYRRKDGALFPKTDKDIKQSLKEVYPIKGREYDVKNIAEGDSVIMVEMVESYPDPKTKQVYRTPLVIVLKMKDGKIKRGRHYCDPDLSFQNLTKEQIEKVFE